MLDDHEQRALDATAARIGHEDPVLAARLRDHTVTSRGPRPRVAGLPPAAWPPTIMFLICLVLVVLPPLVTESPDGSGRVDRAPTAQVGDR